MTDFGDGTQTQRHLLKNCASDSGIMTTLRTSRIRSLTAGSIASSRLAWLSFQSDRAGHNQVGSEFAYEGPAGTQPLLARPVKRPIHQHDKKH
jgi:hypothetical protein